MDRDREWFHRQHLLGVLAMPETDLVAASVWETEAPERIEALIRARCLTRETRIPVPGPGVDRARVTHKGKLMYRLDLWERWRREDLNRESDGRKIDLMTEEQLADLETNEERI